MAVYTKVSLEQAIASLSAYAIGAVVGIDEIASGVENSNFLVSCDDSGSDSGKASRYILTLYEKRVRGEDIPYFLSLMEHLSGKGILCPEPIGDRDGKVLHGINGRSAALFSFLSGESISLSEITVEHCRQVGKALAEIHLASSDFTAVRENNLSFRGWRDLFDDVSSYADRVRPGIAQKLSMELNYIGSHWNCDLPRGTCHADLFSDNVFFEDGILCGIIDFYFACTDSLAYDLAIAMNAWCFERGVFNGAKGMAFTNSYDEVRRLSAGERDCLPLLARGAALRFLLTRLYDWVNHDDGALVTPHDPMDFYNILSFHQNVRDCSSYGL